MSKRSRTVRLGVIALGVLLLGLGALVVQQRARSWDEVYIWPMAPWPASDKEWLTIIERAKRNMNDPEAPWPEREFPPLFKVVRTCAGMPADVRPLQHSVEQSPDKSRRRVEVAYPGFILLLYSNQDLSDCNEFVRGLLLGPLPYLEATDKHICEQMRVMAQGQPKTDVTLRDASPRVARAYLEAFCQ